MGYIYVTGILFLFLIAIAWRPLRINYLQGRGMDEKTSTKEKIEKANALYKLAIGSRNSEKQLRLLIKAGDVILMHAHIKTLDPGSHLHREYWETGRKIFNLSKMANTSRSHRYRLILVGG